MIARFNDCFSFRSTASMASPALSQHAHLTYARGPGQIPHAVLGDFPWIGFDLDYTVARYHNDLAGLVQRCMVDALEHSGYDRSCFDGFDSKLVQRGLIVDMVTGDLIKLGSDGRVAAALHGESWRNTEDIASTYGVGPWRLYPYLHRVARHDDYWPLITAFDSPAQPLWARIIELLGRGDPRVKHVRKGDYNAVRRHLFEAFNFIYDNTEAWDSGRGGFFSAIRAEPGRYILRRPGLRALLERARARGHVLFMATNSKRRFAEFVADVALGPGWAAACFDLVVYDAQKPAFFARAAQPWLAVSAEAEGDGGRPTRTVTVPLKAGGGGGAAGAYVNGSAAAIQALANAHALVRGCPASSASGAASVAGRTSDLAAALAAGGGAVGLTALLDAACTSVTGVSVQLARGGDCLVAAADLLRGPPVPVLYCGDHLHSDVAAAAAAGGEGAGWHVLAVVEELGGALPVGAATALWVPGATHNAGGGGDASPVVTRLPHSVDGTPLTPVTDAGGPGSVGASQFVHDQSPWGGFFEAPAGARSHYCALLERFAWAVTTDVEASFALLLAGEEEAEREGRAEGATGSS